MIGQVMKAINNHFISATQDGTFRITGNVLPEADGAQWVYISGSMYHDGVWECCGGYLTGRSMSELHDEEFEGTLFFLAPPQDFLELCEAVKEYEAKNPVGALQSEAFGGYSYSRGSSAGIGWRKAFASQLNAYRRMYSDI